MNTNKIAELNDKLRKNLFTPGKNQVFISAGVSSLPYLEQARLLDKVQKFNDFNEDNNPYGERDFSRIEHNETMDAGSDNPADENITIRVLTIMRADEY